MIVFLFLLADSRSDRINTFERARERMKFFFLRGLCERRDDLEIQFILFFFYSGVDNTQARQMNERRKLTLKRKKKLLADIFIPFGL